MLVSPAGIPKSSKERVAVSQERSILRSTSPYKFTFIAIFIALGLAQEAVLIGQDQEGLSLSGSMSEVSVRGVAIESYRSVLGRLDLNMETTSQAQRVAKGDSLSMGFLKFSGPGWVEHSLASQRSFEVYLASRQNLTSAISGCYQQTFLELERMKLSLLREQSLLGEVSNLSFHPKALAVVGGFSNTWLANDRCLDLVEREHVSSFWRFRAFLHALIGHLELLARSQLVDQKSLVLVRKSLQDYADLLEVIDPHGEVKLAISLALGLERQKNALRN